MNNLRIKRRYLFIALAVLMLLLGLLFYSNRPGKLHIIADPGATISISRSQGSEFEVIGTGEATYSSRDFAADVYILVSKDGGKTISGAVLQRGSTKELKLTLAKLASVQTVTDGGVISPRIDGTLVQGILPVDHSATSFRTDSYETTRAELVGLPYLQRIIWYDMNNFVYLTLSSTVGRVVNGQDESNQNLASIVGGRVGEDVIANELGSGGVQFIDVSRYPDKPLVLLTKTAIVASDNMGTSVRRLAQVSGSAFGSRVFASKNKIVWLSNNSPSGIDDESQNGTGSQIIEFDYDGKQLREYNAPAELVLSVVGLGDDTYILTEEKLTVINKQGEKTVPLYFKYAADLVLYKDSVLLLADNAVWKINDGGTSIQLLAETEDSGVGLRDSFSVNQIGELLFGTTASLERANTDSRLFRLSF